MIHVIIFDYGGVLAFRRSEKFRKFVNKKYGVTEEQFKKAWKTYNPDFEMGKCSNIKFLKTLSDFWGINPRLQELAYAFYAADEPESKMVRMIKKLKKHFVLALLSNSNKLLTDKIKHYRFLNDVHVKIFSDEVGIRKPDMRIYVHCIKELGVRPEECIFIDDKEENLEPARKLGIHTVLFKDKSRCWDEIWTIEKETAKKAA
jgi:putative hydrolase of the HAD superfamily